MKKLLHRLFVPLALVASSAAVEQVPDTGARATSVDWLELPVQAIVLPLDACIAHVVRSVGQSVLADLPPEEREEAIQVQMQEAMDVLAEGNVNAHCLRLPGHMDRNVEGLGQALVQNGYSIAHTQEFDASSRMETWTAPTGAGQVNLYLEAAGNGGLFVLLYLH